MARPVDRGFISMRDHFGRKSSVHVNFTAITGATLDATEADFAAVVTAIDNLSECAVGPQDLVLNTSVGTNELPSSPDADAGVIMRFYVEDQNTGYKSHIDIPGPIDAAVPSGTTEVNMAQTQVAALISAIQNKLKSNADNDLLVYDVRMVNKRRRTK